MNGQITKGWLSTLGLAIVSIFIALPIVAFGFSQKLQASQTTLLPADLPEIEPSPNGILSTGIDLSIPMATGEANVDLSLVFTGLGLLGNWDLSGLSSIQRERSAGIQFQQTDQYVSSIGGRLLEFNGNYYAEVDNGAMYQPQGNCGQGPCSWYVLLPDGGKMIYGNSSDSVIKGPTSILGASSTVVEWFLSTIEDKNGNYTRIEYTRKNGRLYPKTILYTKNNSVSLLERKIEFEYRNHLFPLISYDIGNRADMTQYLKSIRSFFGYKEIFSYEFQYESDFRTDQLRLTKVQEKLEGKIYKKPIQIHYRSAPDSALSKSISPVNTGAGTPNPSRCKVASDWCLVANFSDFLNPTAATWATIACGLFQIDGTIGRCETGNTWATADINGDGRIEFVASVDAINDSGRTVVPLVNGGNLQPWVAASNNGQKGTTFMVDMNGDGKDDVVGLGIDMGNPLYGVPTTYFFVVSFNTGNGFVAPIRFFPPNGIMGMGYDPNLFAKQLLLMWVSA